MKLVLKLAALVCFILAVAGAGLGAVPMVALGAALSTAGDLL